MSRKGAGLLRMRHQFQASTSAGKPESPSAKAGGREMHRQLAMDHAADEPKPYHDAGRRADGSDVLAIPLFSLLLGARQRFARRQSRDPLHIRELLVFRYRAIISSTPFYSGKHQLAQDPGTCSRM